MTSAAPFRSVFFAPPGDVALVERTATGLLFELCDGELDSAPGGPRPGTQRFRLDVIRPDIVRMKLTLSSVFDETPTVAACFEPPEPSPFDVVDGEDAITLRTAAMTLVVKKRGFAVTGWRSDGSTLFAGRVGLDGGWRGLRVLNDEFSVERRAEPGDSIYGLGEKTGPFERRGRSFVLWNLDVLAPRAIELNHLHEADATIAPTSTRFDPYYTSIPFFVHVAREGGASRVAGFFVDNAYKSRFDFTESDGYAFHFYGGQYTEYVFSGPDLASVLEAYTFVTGRMELPPLWSLGHQQCRWHDYTDAHILELGLEYRTRGIPCDALWLDIGHMQDFRVFSWHQERFPDPPRVLGALLAQGFRAVTIVDPGIKIESGYAVFEQARLENLLCKTEGGAIYTGQVWPGRTAFPDFSLPRARAFWSERVRDHLALGVAGIWNDMNEPATGDVEPFAMRFDRDGANHPHERFHNQYASLMAEATRDGQLKHAPDSRPFTLSRAGFAGIQRLAAQWLGDNGSSFEHLAMQIPMALGMGVSGQPFVGADIPGFAGEATPELAARWFQLGALTPFCRCHDMMGSPPKYPWSFGPEVEAIAREALHLRYRLLPYLYAAFLDASRRGEPIQRPLLFDFPDDPGAIGVDDQFMLGHALLVAPVLLAGARERRVYLPRGGWLDWRDGARHQGGGFHLVPAPLEHIPLYARAHAIVPMLENAPASTRSLRPELVELHWFVGEADGTGGGLLYEDDGETFAHRAGAFVETLLSAERRGRELLLTAARSGAGFPEFRRRALRLVLHGADPRKAWIDGRAVAPEGNAVVFENRGEPFELRAEIRPAQ